MTESHETPLSRWEIVGAWLHVWTPPRNARVPPVPWRKIGIWTAVGVVVCGVALAIAVPRIDTGKRAGAARDAASLAASRAAEHRRLVAEQRVHRGRAAGRGDRVAIYGAATSAVLADAKARVADGELETAVSGIVCAPAEGSGQPAHVERIASVPVGAFDCTAITGKIARSSRNVAGALGYPFRLKVDFAHRSFLWCKQNPLPGERSVPDPSQVVRLPAACRV